MTTKRLSISITTALTVVMLSSVSTITQAANGYYKRMPPPAVNGKNNYYHRRVPQNPEYRTPPVTPSYYGSPYFRPYHWVQRLPNCVMRCYGDPFYGTICGRWCRD